MLPALVRKTWRDDRRATTGWAVAVAAFTALYTGFYSQFQDVGRFKQDALPKGMLDFLGIADMVSPTGYLQATVFTFIGPFLVIAAAVTTAARSIARPEEIGDLELLLTNPLSRTEFARQRLTAHLSEITAVAVVPWLALVILMPVVGLDVPLSHVTAACAALVALAWCFAGIAFLIGAATGRRTTALAMTGAIAVTTYVVNGMVGVVDWLGPVRYLSPFHYFIGVDPLRTGWHLVELAVLLAVAAATAVLGLATFDRRDVGV